MLTKLKKWTGSDPKRMKVYIECYQGIVSENIVLLNKWGKTIDPSTIKNMAHSSKPIFKIMGFMEIYQSANKLESLIHIGSPLQEIEHEVIHFKGLMKNSLIKLNKLLKPAQTIY